MPSIQELFELHTGDDAKLIEALSVDTIEGRASEEYREEYEGARTRRIKSVGKRENKTFNVMKEQEDGTMVKTNEKKTVYVAKLVFPFPKKIVRMATHFLFGGRMTVSADESNDATAEFTDTWDKLKMQTKLKRLARTCMIETKAALLFYPQPIKSGELTPEGELKANVSELKLRCMLLDSKNGEFYPHFDDYGDMDAFIRRYSKKIENRDIEHADLFTADSIVKYSKESGSWAEAVRKPNLFGKIPVVYVEQEKPEWESVATLIDNFEMRTSRLADTNDYFAEPLLKLFGNVKRAPGKEEVGKVVEFDMVEGADGKTTHGDAEYATWDHTPESIKLDLETTWDGIFAMTSTPDLSFNNVKGLSNTSGVALRLMFLDALIKREETGEIFFEALRRSINVVIAGISGYTAIKYRAALEEAEIDVEFSDQLPNDIAEAIDTLVSATGGKPILSQETAAGISPLTKDPEEEISRIRAETSAAPHEPVNIE